MPLLRVDEVTVGAKSGTTRLNGFAEERLALLHHRFNVNAQGVKSLASGELS